MPLWLVKATWHEDEVQATAQWAVNAETAQDAVTTVATRIRFKPHDVEAKRYEPEEAGKVLAADLSPGEARRVI